MEILLKKIIDNNVFYDIFLDRGIDYFLQSIPKLSITSLDENREKLTCICTKNKCEATIDKEFNILKYSCNCDAIKNYKGFCKHLVAMIYQYFYLKAIENPNDFKNENIFSFSFLLDAFNNKIILTPQIEILKKNHVINNIDLLLDNKILFKVDDNEHQLPFELLNDQLKENLNFLLKNSNFIKKFNNKCFTLSDNLFWTFLDFCWTNDINIFNEKDQTKLVCLDYINNENEKKKILDLFFNKKISIKKNYNDLFYCKSDFNVTEHFCQLEQSIFFLFNPIDKYSLVHVVESPNTYDKCKNFYWKFNHGTSKADFIDIYEYVNKNFKDFSWEFDQAALLKNNLLSKDPKLLVELRFNQEINNPVLVIKYSYNDNNYYADDSSTNIESRNLEKEASLFRRINKLLNVYSEQHKCYIFKSEEEFLKIIKWMKVNKNNQNYIIQIAKNLLYKTKSKTKFSISNITKNDDLLSVEWTLANYSKNDIKQIVTSYVKREEFVKLSNGEIIDLLNDIDFNDFENQLRLLNTSINDFLEDKVSVKKWNYALLDQQIKFNQEIKDFINNFKNIDNIEINLDHKLKTMLKPYQIYGIKWLKLHHKLNTGSILSDEMGLGKTIQSIGYLSDYFSSNSNSIALVVAPSSLVYNWKKEIESYASHLKTCVIDGNMEKRMMFFKYLKQYNVVIISYNLLKLSIDQLKDFNFEVMIIDEGHTIKNRFTKFAKSIMTVNANHKIALTGTPMENNTLELWSLFNFVMPGFLNDFNTFKKFISESNDQNYKSFQSKIAPFILRRTKKDVLKELPEKIERLMYINFNEEQKLLYFDLLESIRKDIDKSILVKDIEKNKIFILSLLTKLRQLCCSPKLLYENAKTNGSKFEMCMTLIEEIIAKNEKVLIFSQFTEMISVFQKELYKKNIEFLTITGSTAKKDRQSLVDLFNSNNSIKIFLISLKAGGVGLNLTSANNVIHYDLWWNVSVENQASDRAHRIGQKNNVTVYKLIMNDSIEEKIIDIQNTKKALISKILDFDKIEKDNFSMKEMLRILDIKKFD